MKKEKDVQCAERDSNYMTSLPIYALKSRSATARFMTVNG